MSHRLAGLAIVATLVCGLTACASSETEAGSASPPASTASMTTPTDRSAAPTLTQGAEAVIAIKDFTFEVPATVAPGASVTITNADSQNHSVTSQKGGSDVKVLGKGTGVLTAPSTPGRYPFVCTFHGNMTGTLVVQ